MAGANRDPSSLVQSTSTTGRSVDDVVLAQRAQHLERAHHAENAVEPAAARLRVQVRAGDDRRKHVAAARPPAEDVAHLVDLDPHAEFLKPGDEQVARPPVVVAQGDTVHAAAGRGADLGHRLEAAPQARAVDTQVARCVRHRLAGRRACNDHKPTSAATRSARDTSIPVRHLYACARRRAPQDRVAHLGGAVAVLERRAVRAPRPCRSSIAPRSGGSRARTCRPSR